MLLMLFRFSTSRGPRRFSARVDAKSTGFRPAARADGSTYSSTTGPDLLSREERSSDRGYQAKRFAAVG